MEVEEVMEAKMQLEVKEAEVVEVVVGVVTKAAMVDIVFIMQVEL